jgi:hypothetical protein
VSTRFIVFGLLGLLLAGQVHAQTRPRATNYQMPSDVQAVGGGDKAKSTNYVLDDTIGEPNIGFGRSEEYDLNAGYRQTLETFLSLSCSDSVSLGTIALSGQRSGSGSCVVITDAEAGYSLSWSVLTGSGGASTGYLISADEELIAPFTPAIANTPETWTIAGTASEWGGRLSSDSTDDALEWGVDSTSEKWLNVATSSRTIVTRSTLTSVAGSTEILEFRADVGPQKIQRTGVYQTVVTLTAAAL